MNLSLQQSFTGRRCLFPQTVRQCSEHGCVLENIYNEQRTLFKLASQQWCSHKHFNPVIINTNKRTELVFRKIRSQVSSHINNTFNFIHKNSTLPKHSSTMTFNNSSLSYIKASVVSFNSIALQLIEFGENYAPGHENRLFFVPIVQHKKFFHFL